MKKIIILLLLILLTGCKSNFYNLKYGNDLIVVGYDNEDTISNLDYIDSYTVNEKDKLESITIYVKDRPEEIYLDDKSLSYSISKNCEKFDGELINNNGTACVIHKHFGGKDNTVILYGNILNDDIEDLDRIEISYK